MRPQFQSAAQQERFGGIALAEDAVDDGCAERVLAVADERGAVKVVESLVVGLDLLKRRQQCDGLLVFSEACYSNWPAAG